MKTYVLGRVSLLAAVKPENNLDTCRDVTCHLKEQASCRIMAARRQPLKLWCTKDFDGGIVRLVRGAVDTVYAVDAYSVIDLLQIGSDVATRNDALMIEVRTDGGWRTADLSVIIRQDLKQEAVMPMDHQEVTRQIIEAWRTNNRINLFLIDRIAPDGMKCTLSERGGRNVCRQVAHLHNNRVWHLEKRAKELADGLHIFETDDEPDKKTLTKHLNASAEALERYFRDILDGVPKRRTFKKGVIPYLGYFIAHESHHRGSILLTLKQCGHAPAQDVRMAIWNWDKM